MGAEKRIVHGLAAVALVLLVGGCASSGSSGDAVARSTTTSSGSDRTTSTSSTTSTSIPTTTTTAPAPVIDPRNATYPANACVGGDGTGWESSPITVHDGSGESVAPDGSFGGATLDKIAEIGRVDVDGDGAEEIIVTGQCFGSTIAMCCAGRTSNLLVVLVVRGGEREVQLLGSPNFGRSGEPTRRIERVELDGTDIVTSQPLVYPENDAGETEEVRYRYTDGEWSEVGGEPAAPADSSGPAAVEGVTLDACRSQGTPPVNEAGAMQRASLCLYLAWQAGDRELAEDFGDPVATSFLFETTQAVEPWTFSGCRAGALEWDTTCTFETPQQVTVLLTGTAYDDVLVVATAEYVLE